MKRFPRLRTHGFHQPDSRFPLRRNGGVFTPEKSIDEETNFLEITSIGDEFIVEAENDVRKITFFRCDFEDDFSKIKTKDKIGEWGHLGAHDRLYVRCDLGEFLPFIRVEIERLDFTRVSFNLNASGKNGDLISYNYKYTTGIKSILYYFFE